MRVMARIACWFGSTHGSCRDSAARLVAEKRPPTKFEWDHPQIQKGQVEVERGPLPLWVIGSFK
jgi:hypothetical protein